MSHKNLSAREVIRAKIQALSTTGTPIKQISRILGVARNTVKLWKDKNSVVDADRPGQPTKMSPVTKRMIKRDLKENFEGSISKVTKKLNLSKHYLKKNKKIGRTAVHNFVKSTPWGRKAFKAPEKQILTQKNINDRKKFGETVMKMGYLDEGERGQEKRRYILWTDESTFELNWKSGRHNQRYRTESRKDVPPHLTPKFSAKVMVAGGFCAQGVTKLHFVDPKAKVNASYYREKILPIYLGAMKDKELFPVPRKTTFMQDGATPHSEKQNMALLESQCFNLWGKGVWPGNSPDLNPIENLWAILKEKVYQSPIPTTMEQLKVRIEKSWKSLPPELLSKMAESFKRRVDSMMAADCHHTKY
jgi:DDE superfamily endonuclease/Homeodomain-like domain-containing protein